MPAKHFFYFIFLSIPFIALNSSLQAFFSSINKDFIVFFWVSTIIVFILKFIVDKYIIYRSKNKIKKESIMYLYTSIITTLLTMFIEHNFLSFLKLSVFYSSVVALLIGYTIKYILDYNIVFKEKVTL